MSTLSGRFCLACLAISLFLCTSSWFQQSGHAAERLPDFFVVVSGATEVQHSIFQGKDQITYRLQVPYPAADVLRTINTRLNQTGWQPLKEDWLNPGLPTSHVRGWFYFEDLTTKPSTSVRGWNGDWKNSAHDVLTYTLEYRCPGDLCSSTRDLRDLRVVAIHIPADLAEQIKGPGALGRTGR